MKKEPFAALHGVSWVDQLPNRTIEANGGVQADVNERVVHLGRLGAIADLVLYSTRGPIVDVGPGSGVSTMALARSLGDVPLLGIEMDAMHLGLAWPECLRYPNLRLAWGSLAGLPSNPRFGPKAAILPTVDVPAGWCDVVFSWLGMSRRDIFERTGWWGSVARTACVLIYPKFWRLGLSALPEQDRGRLVEFCQRRGLKSPDWQPGATLAGFARVDFEDCFGEWRETPDGRSAVLAQQVDAMGWILWLSGLFDDTETPFTETLHGGQWDLNLKLDLEVAVAFKSPLEFELEVISHHVVYPWQMREMGVPRLARRAAVDVLRLTPELTA